MMKGIVAIVAAVFIAVAFAGIGTGLKKKACTRKALGEFASWKVEFGKSYNTPAEQNYRMEVFCGNMKTIEAHNTLPEKTFTLGTNFYSDLTNSEFRATFGKGDFVSSAKASTPEISTSNLGDIVVPDSVDWSKSPVIGKVYDIDQCKAGYAFAAIQVVEAAKYLDKNDNEQLSPQNIVDCSSEVPYTNSGCDGGCIFMSLRYVKEQGVATEKAYPYTAGASGSSSFCQAQIARPFKISNFFNIPAGRSDILKNLVAGKPVVVTVDPNAINQHYTGGIFDGTGCSTTPETYYLMLVGYGIDKTVKEKEKSRYWILKNHKSAKWGVNGFMKIARSEGPVPGICGITDNGVYVQF